MRHLVLILGMLLFISLGCEKDDDIVQTPPTDPISVDLVEVETSVIIPSSSQVPTTLNIDVALNSFPVNISSDNGDSIVGTAAITLNRGGVHLATLSTDGDVLGYSIMTPENSTSLSLTPRSTAEAIVYLNPLIISSDYDEYEALSLAITTNSEFQALVNDVEAEMADGLFNFDFTLPSYARVVANVIDGFTDVINSDPVSVLRTSSSTSEFDFYVVNARKRWVSVYVNPIEDGNVLPASELMFRSESDYFWDIDAPDVGIIHDGQHYSMPSPEVSFFSNGLFPFISAESPVLRSPISPHFDEMKVTCFGPGFDGLPQDIFGEDQDEFQKGAFAVSNTIMHDFIGPILDLASGVKGIVASPQLRGRPTSSPVWEAYEIFLSRLNVRMFVEFGARIEAERASGSVTPAELLGIQFDIVASFLAEEENQRLLLNIIRERGIVVSPLFFVKKVLPAIQAYNSAEAIVSLSLAVSAIANSPWSKEFIFTLQPSDGIFDVYRFSNENIISAQLAIGPNEDTIWITDGINLYEWTNETQTFSSLDFYNEYILASGNPATVIAGIASDPITGDLYIGLTSMSPLLSWKSCILKRIQSGEYETIFTSPNIIPPSSAVISNPMAFNINGELWVRTVTEDENDYLIVINTVENNVEQIFDPGIGDVDLSFDAAGGLVIFSSSVDGFFSVNSNGIYSDTTYIETYNVPENYRLGGPIADPTYTLKRNGDLCLSGISERINNTPGSYHLFLYLDKETGILTGDQEFDGFSSVDNNVFAKGFVHLDEDISGKVWFASRAIKETIFFRNNGEYIYFDPNNSNIPSQGENGMIHDLLSIGGSAQWILIGNYAVRYNG